MAHSRSLKLLRTLSVVMLLMALTIALARPPLAAANSSTALHITVSPKFEFTSFSCPMADLCYVTGTAQALSNLSTRAGRADFSGVLTPVNGSFAPCNHVSEDMVFTFTDGTLSIHSEHTDCPATIRPGPRIVTEFQVTGGTGAFSGATGGGTELGQMPIVYNGNVYF